MSPSARTRLFLVDDHSLFLSGLRAELGAHLDIVGDAGDADAAIEGILATRPDVVLLDVHLPGGGGRAVLEAVLRKLQLSSRHELARWASDRRLV